MKIKLLFVSRTKLIHFCQIHFYLQYHVTQNIEAIQFRQICLYLQYHVTQNIEGQKIKRTMFVSRFVPRSVVLE